MNRLYGRAAQLVDVVRVCFEHGPREDRTHDEVRGLVSTLAEDLRVMMTPQGGDYLFNGFHSPAHGRRAFHCLVLAAEHWEMNGGPAEAEAPSSQMLLGACHGAADILSRVEALAPA